MAVPAEPVTEYLVGMPRRIIVFCILAFVAAALFLRLGVWQVGRLRERQAYNANFVHQQASQPVPFNALPRDTALAHYRGVRLHGLYDYAHGLVWSPRTRRGSPGVDLLTPVRVAGTDTAVLVDRGWVYSPDGAFVDDARWREGDTANVSGYVELYLPDTVVAHASNPRIVRHVTRAELAAKIPYPVAPFYLVALSDTTGLAHPARRELPPLEEGPHRGYAIQWFSFAIIALGGAAIVLRRERRREAS